LQEATIGAAFAGATAVEVILVAAVAVAASMAVPAAVATSMAVQATPVAGLAVVVPVEHGDVVGFEAEPWAV